MITKRSLCQLGLLSQAALLGVVGALPVASLAATYKCEVTSQTYFTLAGRAALRKQLVDAGLAKEETADSEVRHVAADVLKKNQAHLIVEDEKKAFVERCSFVASANRVTCDRYKVDPVVADKNVDLKKFYLFRSQFDVQIFRDLSFIENNGRGGLAYGVCKLIRP